MAEIYYGVYQEHTLGYVIQHETGPKYLGILRASIIRGSPYSELSGPICIDEADLRKATLKDFDDYRVSLPPDFI